MCQNGGTLDAGTCMCSCVGGFSGANCESECNVKKLIGKRFIITVVNLGSVLYFTDICICNPPKRYKLEINRSSYITLNDDPLIFSQFIPILACPLTCHNGGTRNETTCTCACADGYSGDTCGSECIMCHIDSCSLLLVRYELALKHFPMRISLILHYEVYSLEGADDGTNFKRYVTAIVLHELDILISYVLTMAYLVMSCYIIRW